MFSAIYLFTTKAGKDSEFIRAWTELTKLIYEFEGSLGSRLHKEKENHYIAYAQWPSRDIWKNSGDKLPPKAKEFRDKMREACEEVKTLHELELVEDLLREHEN